MYSRFLKPPDQSYFLLGPRGTGKSTFLKSFYQNNAILNLLDPKLYRELTIAPERLANIIDSRPDQRTWVIDEIQRVPALLPLIHQMIEERKALQFVLTGSSARKLRQVSTDLLAGRALHKTMHPFMAWELGADFKFDKAIKYGMVPLVWGAQNPEETIGSYLSLYLDLEVKTESLVRNIHSFSRFLESISFSQGSLINFSDIARDVGVDRKTVQNYCGILTDLLIAHILPVFSKRAKRELVKHEKFYYFDCGVYQSIRPSGPLDEADVIAGARIETLVFQHLKAWSAYRSNGADELYFWQSRLGLEVDFILYGEQNFWAFEVKASTKLKSEWFKPLTAFADDYPMAKTVLLYGGTRTEKVGNHLCIPIESFLKSLNPGQPMEEVVKNAAI